MRNKLQKFWTESRDWKRVILLLLVVIGTWALSEVLARFLPLSGLDLPMTATAYLSLLLLATHLWRRIMFPHLDLQRFAKTAASQPLGAALCFSSMLGFLGLLVYLSATLWRG